MVSDELKDFLIRVLTSWQVIAVVLVVILYIALVSYVARSRKRIVGPPPVKRAPQPSKDKKPVKTSDADNKNEKDRKK